MANMKTISAARISRELSHIHVDDIIPINTEGAELYHYGVPGMKWGVRKKTERQAYKDIVAREKQRPLYDRIAERKLYGRRGVKKMRKRAAKYVAKGMSQEEALKKSKQRTATYRTAKTVAKGALIVGVFCDVRFNNARASKAVLGKGASIVGDLLLKGGKMILVSQLQKAAAEGRI